MKAKELHLKSKQIIKASHKLMKALDTDSKYLSLRREYDVDYMDDPQLIFQMKCAHSDECLSSEIYLMLYPLNSKDKHSDYYLNVFGPKVQHISFRIGDEPFKDQLRDALSYIKESLEECV